MIEARPPLVAPLFGSGMGLLSWAGIFVTDLEIIFEGGDRSWAWTSPMRWRDRRRASEAGTCDQETHAHDSYAVPKDLQHRVVKFHYHGQTMELKHGTVVIAAITSCTNTMNPIVMICSGLVAKKPCKLGLEVKP
ncbi:hypothetical protein GUJ93_ZPchr0006g42282 [Zizania palustris]|uniref:Aconitase/3-isopropylmalate dehydratase large subunit alpha/beta/alpha domain-containing protein n=1 Tax=Zizania palustris TaxID=103762 RepID=A0A8J5SMC9_ZIZPA|nr:hypothetical protein GUJ93_ZPchr0006g42282 [Zizania palustris]